MIFLDTSAIYALADKSDPNHADAYRKFDLALKRMFPLKSEQLRIYNSLIIKTYSCFPVISF